MKSCPKTGKTSYDSSGEAHTVRLKIAGKRRGKNKRRVLFVYKCSCGSWHLGNTRKKVRREDRDDLALA